MTTNQRKENIKKTNPNTIPPRNENICDQDVKFENLSKSGKDLLTWYHKLNHMNIQTLQDLARHIFLPYHLSQCERPLCSACQLGKQKRLSRNKEDNNIAKEDITKPGGLVSIDQAESSNPKRSLTYSGHNNEHEIKAVTIFVDTIPKKVVCSFQTSTNADETIQGKLAMEREVNKYNVQIKRIKADNGVFKSAKLQEHINSLEQQLTFCRVSAHHQNGVAERYIQTLVNTTRTSLLDVHGRWPEAINMELWTFAFQHVVDQWNNTPKRNLEYKTPNEVFSGISARQSGKSTIFKDLQPFGCPVYVLDKCLADGGHAPKWHPHPTVGIYLGYSRDHPKCCLGTQSQHRPRQCIVPCYI
eukprot:3348432-Ditylum_brightwellii.AAC.1